MCQWIFFVFKRLNIYGSVSIVVSNLCWKHIEESTCKTWVVLSANMILEKMKSKIISANVSKMPLSDAHSYKRDILFWCRKFKSIFCVFWRRSSVTHYAHFKNWLTKFSQVSGNGSHINRLNFFNSFIVLKMYKTSNRLLHYCHFCSRVCTSNVLGLLQQSIGILLFVFQRPLYLTYDWSVLELL